MEIKNIKDYEQLTSFDCGIGQDAEGNPGIMIRLNTKFYILPPTAAKDIGQALIELDRALYPEISN